MGGVIPNSGLVGGTNGGRSRSGDGAPVGGDNSLAQVGRESRARMHAVVNAWESFGKQRLNQIRWVNSADVPQAEEYNDSSDSYENEEDDDSNDADESTGSLRDFVVDDDEDEEEGNEVEIGGDDDEENDEEAEEDDPEEEDLSERDQNVVVDEQHVVESGIGGGGSNDECIICQESRCNACVNPCGHAMFCYECLHKMERKAKRETIRLVCPSCRGRVSSILKLYR